METISLPHLWAWTLYVGLFRDVKNTAFLRQQLLDGNTDYQFAFVDASMLVSRKAVEAACFRAIEDSVHDRMKTHNFHSEVVFTLSSINNISESFRRMGLQDTTKHVLAIKLLDSLQTMPQVESFLRENVDGTLVSFTDKEILGMRDAPRIRKHYKLPPVAKGDSEGSLSRTDEALVIGSMALRGS